MQVLVDFFRKKSGKCAGCCIFFAPRYIWDDKIIPNFKRKVVPFCNPFYLLKTFSYLIKNSKESK
jgi:hypothetical protein